jgi:hypothetical protein
MAKQSSVPSVREMLASACSLRRKRLRCWPGSFDKLFGSRRPPVAALLYGILMVTLVAAALIRLVHAG